MGYGTYRLGALSGPAQVPHSVLGKQPERVIEPRRTPPLPAEAPTIPRPHQMAPDLPLDPPPHDGQAPARVPDPEVVGVDPVSWTPPWLGRKGASTMPKSHRPYPPAFRRQMIELVRRGRTPEELAREFEPSAQAIRNWVKQAALDAGQRTDGLTTEEHE